MKGLLTVRQDSNPEAWLRYSILIALIALGVFALSGCGDHEDPVEWEVQPDSLAGRTLP